MKKITWKDSYCFLGKALERLKEALSAKNDEYAVFIRDSVIQRFEFTIELYWKTLKKILAYEKIMTTTPRDVFSKAFQFYLIDDELVWIAMIDDRNNTSHEYKEDEAKRIFGNIKNSYYPVLQATYERLEKRIEKYEKEGEK